MSGLKNVKELVPAQVQNASQEVTAASGTVNAMIRSGQLVLNTSGTPDVVLGTPQPGDELLIIGKGSGAVTVTLPSGVTWDGTNRIATFGSNKLLLVRAESTTRFRIIVNTGTVAFS